MNAMPPAIADRFVAFANATSSALLARLREQMPGALPADLQWRLKSDESIEEKRRRRQLGLADPVNDVLGIRIVVAHAGLVEAATQIVETWIAKTAELRVVERADYINAPVSPAHRAIHLDAVFQAEARQDMAAWGGVEFQVTTQLQRLLSAVSHDVVYHKSRSPAETAQVQASLARLTEDFARLDHDLAEFMARAKA